jgi:hypothetical protein
VKYHYSAIYLETINYFNSDHLGTLVSFCRYYLAMLWGLIETGLSETGLSETGLNETGPNAWLRKVSFASPPTT